MKYPHNCFITLTYNVAPARERGLKSRYYQTLFERSSRSRKGAWIEMLADQTFAEECDVAPARERGLNLMLEKFRR